MKTRLFVVRHAEAEGNLYRRIHGQYDSLVTPNGLRQIAALAERFRDETVDVCYASDLVRTRTTAQAVYLPKNIPLYLDRRLREVNLGVWEDLPFGELYANQPGAMDAFNNDVDHWHVEGAEDFRTYSTRFLNGLTDIARRHPGQTVALFSHGCVIRSMDRLLFPAEEMPGYCDNTSVSLLEYEDGVFRAVYLYDDRHLTPEISTLAQQKWWRGGVDRNLWFRPLGEDKSWYVSCLREAWDSPMPFPGDGGDLYRAALEGAAGVPDALCEVLLERERVGLVQLDAREGALSLLYLTPSLRRQRLGVQLLGQAVSVLRRLGWKRLLLRVPAGNRPAIAFFRKHGAAETAAAGPEGTARMELDIRPDRDLAPEKTAAVLRRPPEEVTL